MTLNQYKVLVLGAGSGGISLISKLLKTLSASEIAVVEPAKEHYYQPFWSLAGAGVLRKEQSKKDMAEVMPEGIKWFKQSVKKIDPSSNTAILDDDSKVEYEYLIVATGLKMNWESVEGLKENLGKNGVCSIYDYHQVDYTALQIHQLQSGKALFVMPPTPIKCAGAPQKIMYLADGVFRQRNVRQNIDIQFWGAGKGIFGIPIFATPLNKVINDKNIHTYFEKILVKIDGKRKVATFRDNSSPEAKLVEESFDLLHVVPTQSAHDYVRESGLAFSEGEHKGWLEVDKHTLQHLKYKNIFGIGDVTGIPNSKTGAAIRKQYPIVAQNLLDVMQGRECSQKYNGYSSCPLITEEGKVILAEFGYDGKLMPSFPLDPAVPRRSMWYLKRYLLPILYWHFMLKGNA